MDPDFEHTSRTLTLDNSTVHYHEVGTGPVLLLIHGSGPGVTAWANFQGTMGFFAEKFRCIAPDLPGYGKSDAIEGDPINGPVQILVDLLSALGVDQAHVIGNSLGGILGALLAAQHPSLVTSFTAIGGIGLNVFTPFPGEGLNLLNAFAENPTRERMETWLRSMVYDQSLVDDELIDARFTQATEPKTLNTTRQLYSREALAQLTAFRTGPYATKAIEHLSSIAAPTLITWGRDDRVSPMDMALLPMRLIPNCQLHVFPNCGHWVMIEQKDQFEAAVLAFLEANPPTEQPQATG